MRIDAAIFARFISKIDVRDNFAECWNWQAGLFDTGYGQFHIDRKPLRAHRVSYFVFRGDPGELKVLHDCDNPICCNPLHLSVGTQKKNIVDMFARGRRSAGGTSNPRSVFQTADIVKIRQLATHRDIADTFGICRQAISAIVSGRTYKEAH